jgi:hypothetical protein
LANALVDVAVTIDTLAVVANFDTIANHLMTLPSLFTYRNNASYQRIIATTLVKKAATDLAGGILTNIDADIGVVATDTKFAAISVLLETKAAELITHAADANYPQLIAAAIGSDLPNRRGLMKALVDQYGKAGFEKTTNSLDSKFAEGILNQAVDDEKKVVVDGYQNLTAAMLATENNTNINTELAKVSIADLLDDTNGYTNIFDIINKKCSDGFIKVKGNPRLMAAGIMVDGKAGEPKYKNIVGEVSKISIMDLSKDTEFKGMLAEIDAVSGDFLPAAPINSAYNHICTAALISLKAGGAHNCPNIAAAITNDNAKLDPLLIYINALKNKDINEALYNICTTGETTAWTLALRTNLAGKLDAILDIAANRPAIFIVAGGAEPEERSPFIEYGDGPSQGVLGGAILGSMVLGGAFKALGILIVLALLLILASLVYDDVYGCEKKIKSHPYRNILNI